jgi:hypothetical protein
MRQRARAIAQRRNSLPWLPWAALLASIAFASVAGHAQTSAPSLTPRLPTSPPGASDGVITPAPNTDKGVIVPPENGVVSPGNPDPGINVPGNGGSRTPVIPPPGSPGGNPNVLPK